MIRGSDRFAPFCVHPFPHPHVTRATITHRSAPHRSDSPFDPRPTHLATQTPPLRPHPARRVARYQCPPARVPPPDLRLRARPARRRLALRRTAGRGGLRARPLPRPPLHDGRPDDPAKPDRHPRRALSARLLVHHAGDRRLRDRAGHHRFYAPVLQSRRAARRLGGSCGIDLSQSHHRHGDGARRLAGDPRTGGDGVGSGRHRPRPDRPPARRDRRSARPA